MTSDLITEYIYLFFKFFMGDTSHPPTHAKHI